MLLRDFVVCDKADYDNAGVQMLTDGNSMSRWGAEAILEHLLRHTPMGFPKELLLPLTSPGGNLGRKTNENI